LDLYRLGAADSGILEIDYPQVPKIELVMDNLNTHSIASLYHKIEPETALCLAND